MLNHYQIEKKQINGEKTEIYSKENIFGIIR